MKYIVCVSQRNCVLSTIDSITQAGYVTSGRVCHETYIFALRFLFKDMLTSGRRSWESNHPEHYYSRLTTSTS